MSDFCYIHAADLHLDTPFEGFKKTAPEVHTALLDASLQAWDALVDLALERDAAFLLLAGDLYDGAQRGLRAQLRFHRGVSRLCDAGIQVLAVHGNHDPVDEGWSAVRSWPEGFTVFPTSQVSSVVVEKGGERLATVYGQSYAQRETKENLALGFRRGGEGGLHIGLLHCNVGGAPGHANYSPCSVADLCAADMDYWALGHVHRHAIVRDADPTIVYPGNLQGRSPQPGERGAKGAVVVDVRGGRVSGLTHVALDRVRFVEETVDVSACEDLIALEAHLANATEALRRQVGERGLMLRVRLTGAAESLAADLARKDVALELIDSLRERAFGMTPFLWWDGLKVDAAPRHVDTVIDDFTGSLEQLFTSIAEDTAATEALVSASLEKLPQRKQGVEFPTLDPADNETLLRAGREVALELLSSAGDAE